MSFLANRQESLLAVNTAIDGFLTTVFGDDFQSRLSSKETGSHSENVSITPIAVDISGELLALDLKPAQVQALLMEFNRSLALLTKHWENVQTPRPSTLDLQHMYSQTIQGLYEAEVQDLQLDFLSQIKDRIEGRHCEDLGSNHPEEIISHPCDPPESACSQSDSSCLDEGESEPEESSAELERYYMILERLFASGIQHPTRELKAVMSAEWGVSQRSVAVWFQNRRDRKDDDIIAEIDFTTRLNLGIEAEDEWSDEGEVPWDTLEDFDDDDVPDLPLIESGAAPYRVPSLSHSVATESESSSSRLPSPGYKIEFPSPRSKSPEIRPTTPEALSQTSLCSISASPFTFAAPAQQAQNSFLYVARECPPLFHTDSGMPSQTVNIDRNWLRSTSQHHPSQPQIGQPRRTLGPSSAPRISVAAQPSTPPFTPPLRFTSLHSPPAFPSLSSEVRSTSRPSFSTSSRASTPALSTTSTSEASVPVATPTTHAFVSSFSPPVQSCSPSRFFTDVEIDEETGDPTIPVFDFDFGPPHPIQSYGTYRDIHLKFETSGFESIGAEAKRNTSVAVEGQTCRPIEVTEGGPSKALLAPECDTNSVSDAENNESEVGRIIFFPSAQGLSEEEGGSVILKHPNLNRPPASFEDAVQLHFLATAAALVDDREVRRDAEVIDIVAEALSDSNSKTSPVLVANEPVMDALLPMPKTAKVEDSSAATVAVPEHIALPPSPCIPSSYPSCAIVRPESDSANFIGSSSTLVSSRTLGGDTESLSAESPTTPPHRFDTCHSNDPADIPLPPSPSPLTPALTAPDSFVGSSGSPPCSSVDFTSDASSPSCPPSPHEIGDPLPEVASAKSVIVFPSTSDSLSSKFEISYPLSLEEPPLLDLSWGSDLDSCLNRAREVSPFEEFMPASLIFQPPPPKHDPEVQCLLDSVLKNWTNVGLGPLLISQPHFQSS
ncbi:uncharacterized protein EI90DRAFT_3162376 [Cantharellus anzutake]|uniref:uncharacterized protein n=1 Tax=Cantharellus anzutake TaxID=1750568 RepID=UPI00190537B9|nr:uncharacterized protein EI90DRAFT_3162376 [Cantharellus anzutake]KAF8308785.1 hypothetical protein EI90DRAFT_3162376 [Cantharellus anzutake]